MATRFYFGVAQTAPIALAVDSSWTRSAVGAITRKLLRKTQLSTVEALTLTGGSFSTTGGASEKDVGGQFISEPLNGETISGTVSIVVKCGESGTTANAQLCVVIRAVSNDGATIRGTLLTLATVDTEFATTAATRIASASALTTTSIQSGDRLVVEIGANFLAGGAGTTANQTFGYNAASDFALTTALTTSLNPWIEFSQDLFPALPNNYQTITVGDGMSTTGRIR